MVKDTVAAVPKLAATDPTSKHKPPKEPHQCMKQEIETMDTCDLTDQITDCSICSRNHPGPTTHTNNFNHMSGMTRHHHPTNISTMEYPWFGEQSH